MTLRQYLISMAVGTLIAVVATVSILLLVNPEQIGVVATAALLVSLGLSLTGALSLLGAIVRVYVLRRDGLVTRHVRVSFRQGALVAFLAVIALELSHLRLFAWWSIVLAIAAVAVAEYFFLSSDGYDDAEALGQG